MKKKYLLITLTLCGLLAFGGCNKAENLSDARGTIVSESTETENEVKESADTESTDTDNAESENVESENVESENAESENAQTDNAASESSDAEVTDEGNTQDEGSITGEVTENIYENAYFGVGCKLLDSYEFMTQEQINNNNENTKKLAKNEEVSKALDSGSTFVDMQAINYQNNSNMIFVLSKTQSIVKGMAQEDYYAATIPSLQDQLGQMGMEDLVINTVPVTFAGSEQTAIELNASYSGMNLYQYQIVLIKDDYTANLTFTSFTSKEEAAKLMESYYSLN